MPTAFAYARVSTKEQAAKGNSIPEQLDRIHRFAEQNGIQIVRTYQDSDSAFHDAREQFPIMISDATRNRPDFIIMDDSSRFARTRQAAIETKQILRRHGINIRFVSEPYVDPKSITGLWIEGIQEIKNEATSREIAFHSWKGMSHNIQNRDNETGWCYKNGGPAPYGYSINWVNRGQNPRGKPVMKSLWELDSKAASLVHEIIVDLYTSRQMSYQKIRDELNTRDIPSPKGGVWSTTTVSELLKDHRIEQYAGTGFWNKEATRDTIGQKYKPREEWITVDNAHPAIISQDELTAALERKRQNQQSAPYGRTRESKYLLTGQNFEGHSMFTCGCCDSNVIGYGNNTLNWRNYICGANRMKGDIACISDWKVKAEWIEQRIVDEITQRYTTPTRVDELVNGITSSLQTKHTEIDKQISSLAKESKECELQITRLMDAIKSGVDASLVATEVNTLKRKKDDLNSQITALKSSHRQEVKVDTNALRQFFTNFPTAYDEATTAEKRDLIRTFVRHIKLMPESKEIRIEFYPDKTVQSIGVGDAPRPEILKYTLYVR